MAIIKKKIWLGYYDDLLSGKKKYDLRLNDFKVEPGDTLLLEEWDQKKSRYTGRRLEKKVTYVRIFKLNEMYWPKKEIEAKGLQVISLE